jgi:hypothetical protein
MKAYQHNDSFLGHFLSSRLLFKTTIFGDWTLSPLGRVGYFSDIGRECCIRNVILIKT